MQAVAACADAVLDASGCGRSGSLGTGCAVCAGARERKRRAKQRNGEVSATHG